MQTHSIIYHRNGCDSIDKFITLLLALHGIELSALICSYTPKEANGHAKPLHDS